MVKVRFRRLNTPKGQCKVSEIEYPEGAMSCLVVKNVEEAKETARKHVREKTDKSKREQEKIDYVKNALKTVKYEECLTPQGSREFGA